MSLKKLINQIESLNKEINQLSINLSNCQKALKKESGCDIAGIRWERNNCGVDSILMALLYPRNEYINKKLITNRRNIVSKTRENINKYPKIIENFDDKDINKQRELLDKSLTSLSNQIIHESPHCSNFRNNLAKLQSIINPDIYNAIKTKTSIADIIELKGWIGPPDYSSSPIVNLNVISNEYNLDLFGTDVSNAQSLNSINDFINEYILTESNRMVEILMDYKNNPGSINEFMNFINKLNSGVIYVSYGRNSMTNRNYPKKLFDNINLKNVKNILRNSTGPLSDNLIPIIYPAIRDISNISDILYLHAIVYYCSAGHICAMIKCDNDWYFYDGMHRPMWVKVDKKTVISKLKDRWDFKKPGTRSSSRKEALFIYWDNDHMHKK